GFWAGTGGGDHSGISGKRTGMAGISRARIRALKRKARMKGKVALLALGFGLAFALSSYPSRAFSAPSAKRVDAARIVTLVCTRFTSNSCTSLEQVAADGTLTPYTAPPSGFVLVVTDFVWKAALVTPGQVAFATLHHQLTSPPRDVSFSTAVATSDGAAVTESHF